MALTPLGEFPLKGFELLNSSLTPPQGSLNIPTTAYPKSSATSQSTSAFDWDSPVGTTLSQLLNQMGSFSVPTNLAPTSTASSASTGESTSLGTQQATSLQEALSQQQSTGQSLATSQQQAQSLQEAMGQAGINWQNPLVSALLPSLISSGTGLQGVADNMGTTLQDQYSALMRQSMGPEAFQGTLNQLASKNMLNSSVAGNALSQTAFPLAQAIGNQAFQSQLAGQQAKLQIPQSLSDLARLGQESTNLSTWTSTSGGESKSTSEQQSTGGSSSTGTSQSTGNQQSTSTQKATSESLNTNPLAAYETMAQFYPSILQALGGVGRESDATSTSSSTNELSPYELMAQLLIANQMA